MNRHLLGPAVAGAEVEAGDYVEYVLGYECARMLELLFGREEEHTRLVTSHGRSRSAR